MSIPNEILDQAYAVYEEWGPDRRVDRVERLKQTFPSLTEADVASVSAEMKRVSSTVWKVAQMGGEAKMPKSKIVKLLQKEHPYLKDKGLTHAVYLVNYYAWHEGYDK
jgi:hypothetical protein